MDRVSSAAMGESRAAEAQWTEARVARAVSGRSAVGLGPSMQAVIQARLRRQTVEKLGVHLKDHWPKIRSRLLGGTCESQPVRRMEIPKAIGGVHLLAGPTVLDRFIRQVVLQEDWRFQLPGRSAHQADGQACPRAFPCGQHGG